jgi:prepilin-type N-terminal cleavage/methylation domain-containing protein
MTTRVRDLRVRGSQGFTMLEMLLALFIFSIVLGALGTLFYTTRQSFDYSTAQSHVQRNGTIIQEWMQKELTPALALQVVDCGPNGTVQKSLMYQTQTGATRCMYERMESGDPGPQLYRCNMASWTVGGGCTNTAENLLRILLPSVVSENLGAQVFVQNTQFTRVTCLPNASGSCGDAGRSVLAPLVDARFDMHLSAGVLNDMANAYTGQRFLVSIATRN